jgi:hypothetical protein
MKQHQFSIILSQLLLKFTGILSCDYADGLLQITTFLAEGDRLYQLVQALSPQDRSHDRGLWIRGAT